VCLKVATVDAIERALAVAGVRVYSATRRAPSLDDVYLQLTGDRIAATSD
jgi:hypothetical protein